MIGIFPGEGLHMVWRVFFIGPMSDDYAGHIERLRDYFVDRLTRVRGYARVDGEKSRGVVLEKDEDRVFVIIPSEHEVVGNIPTNVFHQIDIADMVIADLSGKRAPVVYELAMAHALGIDTILVGDTADQLFYLQHYRFSRVDFQADVWSSPSLDNHIDLWLDNRLKRPNASNPIHEFYGAPLLDISAASGLAAGFFDNFARPVLGSGTIVERREVSVKHPTLGWLGRKTRQTVETSRPLKGLIVARPRLLTQEIVQFETELFRSLEKSFEPELSRFKNSHVYISINKHDGGKRTPFFVVNDYAIDVPRTMFSMKFSRRLERLRALALEPYVDLNMQNVLIECFFDSVLKRITNHRELKIKLEARQIEFHVGTAEQIPEIIKTGRSDTLSFLTDATPRE
jgi:hypothetical protein